MSVDSDLGDFAIEMAPALWRAAELARSLEGRVANSPKPLERTAAKQALTAADTATQEVLLEHLFKRFPYVSLAAEEDTPAVANFSCQDQDALVVIDPIDGTLHSYLEGSGPYAVIVGLALRGQFEAGLVALPREGLLLSAKRGCGAAMARAGGAFRSARVLADGQRILVSHGMPSAVCQRLREQGFDVVSACGGAVAVAPLIPGVRAGLRYAAGEQGVSIRGRVGALIAREAGAFVQGDAGQAFPPDLETPSSTLRVVAAEEDLRILDDGLQAAGLGA